MDKLFSPYQIKGITIKNRIVLPPIVRFGWGNEEGLVSELHLKHYEWIARAGTGLIIVEATCVARDGRLADTQLGLWDDSQIAGMRQLAARCHAHGAVVLVQLHHAGFRRRAGGINSLSLHEIKELQDAFMAAARRAKEAELDGIELHAAHGFLFSQFASPLTNQRTDDYGGDLEKRLRFISEVLQRLKPLADERFILGCRMGANEPQLTDGLQIAQRLEAAGVELLHVSGGLSADSPPPVPEGFPYQWRVYCGMEVKKRVRVPVIVVGGIRTPEQARAILDTGWADFVAVARGQLADPDWARHAREGSAIVPCQECQRCQWYTDGRKCPAGPVRDAWASPA